MTLTTQPLRRTASATVTALAVLFGLVAITPPVQAQTAASAGAADAGAARDVHVYDVTLRGIRAAEVSVDAEQAGNGYRVRAVIQTTGLGSAVRRVRFVAEATGTTRNGRYRPTRYSEDADTGKRQSVSVIEYTRSVPRVVAYRSEQDHRASTVDPATQGGTLDPMTSLYAVLRDTPREAACTASFASFDGRRRTETRLIAATPKGDRLICQGEYRRIAGYRPEELAERSRFPFTLTYAPLPDGRMRVAEVSLDTLYGKAVLKRR
ncbi:MAG: DUF3108 domain-containing protein [Gemmobacter sp.]